jgi:hypothetical protein
VTDSPWPLTLSVSTLAAMLNCELADHEVYEGVELQWFDDDVHGTGMLVFLQRRADRLVDYYVDPELRVDRAGYGLGAGTGAWYETTFDVARLAVADDGVDAHVRFTDADGRVIEVRVDDRDGRRRRRGALLAPVGSGIESPTSLLLVWMPAFDLVRVTGTPPSVRIDGRPVTTGRLPGARLHRHHLVKYAAPVVAVQVNRTDDDAPEVASTTSVRRDAEGRLVTVTAEQGGHTATLQLSPGLPGPSALEPGASGSGRWHVVVAGSRITGGTWAAARGADDDDDDDGLGAGLTMDVDEPWRPGPLPRLMRVVTSVAPVFRRWPTTYRWRWSDGQARWERTGGQDGRSYRRLTAS